MHFSAGNKNLKRGKEAIESADNFGILAIYYMRGKIKIIVILALFAVLLYGGLLRICLIKS